MMLVCARLGLTEEFDECRPEIEGAMSSLLDVALRHCSVALALRREWRRSSSCTYHARTTPRDDTEQSLSLLRTHDAPWRR